VVTLDGGRCHRGWNLGLLRGINRWDRRWGFCVLWIRLVHRIARLSVGCRICGSIFDWLSSLKAFNLLVLAFDCLLENSHSRIDGLRLSAKLLKNAVDFLLLCRGQRLTRDARSAGGAADIGLLLGRDADHGKHE